MGEKMKYDITDILISVNSLFDELKKQYTFHDLYTFTKFLHEISENNLHKNMVKK